MNLEVRNISSINNYSSIEYLFDNFIAFLDVTNKTALTYKKALKQVFNYFGERNIKQPTRDNILAFKKELFYFCFKACIIYLKKRGGAKWQGHQREKNF